MTADPTEKLRENQTAAVVVSECPGEAGGHFEVSPEDPSLLEAELKEFQWSKSLQGLLLSCFFYGYILTQIIGGYFSDKVGVGAGLAWCPSLPILGECSLSLVASPCSWWGC